MAAFGSGAGGLWSTIQQDASSLLSYGTSVGEYELQQASGAPAPSSSLLGGSSLVWLLLIGVAAYFIYKEA